MAKTDGCLSIRRSGIPFGWTLNLLIFATVLGGGISRSRADEGSKPILGRIIQNQYLPPSETYSITLPVQPEFGGSVTDTADVVTFQDEFTLHASIACFRMDSAQEREDQTRGRRDYLVWFYRQQVHSQFKRRFPGASIDSARFIPEMLGGSLLVYSRLPGGSMFKVLLGSSLSESTTEACRGNMLFVQDNHLFVVSVELAKLLLDPEAMALSPEGKQELLRKQLLDIVGRITFKSAAPAP